MELCARPDYADMIYDEIQSVDSLDHESIEKLPILDSFIKETVRLNPLDKSKNPSLLLSSYPSLRF